MISKSILDPLKGSPTILSTHQAPKVLGVTGCIGKNSNPTLARDSIKIEYISRGQSSSIELVFSVELGPNPNSKNIRGHAGTLKDACILLSTK